MSERETNLGRDLLGIALFAMGALLGVSVAMGYLHLGGSEGSIWRYLDGAAIRFFGRPACALLAVLLAVMGARLWLSGKPHKIARNLLGTLGLTAGISILMGALSPAGSRYGGWWGFSIGGFLASLTSPFLGAPFGLLCAFAAAWFAWLRPRRQPSWDQIREEQPSQERHPESDLGVSAEEALELIPRKVVKPGPALGAPGASPFNSPVPVDRRPPALPAGTSPYTPSHAQVPTQSQSRAPALHEWPAQGAVPAGLAADANLARSSPSAGEAGRTASEPVEERQLASPLDAAPLAGSERRAQAMPADLEELEEELGSDALAQPLIREPGVADVMQIEPLGAPIWEQEGLFEEDEPVDAYGTPIALVESLRAESASAPAPAAEDEEEAAQVHGLQDEEVEEELAEEDEEFLEEDEEVTFAITSDAEEELEPAADDVEEAEAEADEEPARSSRQEPLFAELGKAAEPEASPPGERDVVLRPQAAPIAQGEFVPANEEEELVYKAGILIVERQRVAVSMLQREFGLDFEQATALLDRLQQSGLIGPYLGGQRRDILLTLDQWRGRMLAR